MVKAYAVQSLLTRMIILVEDVYRSDRIEITLRFIVGIGLTEEEARDVLILLSTQEGYQCIQLTQHKELRSALYDPLDTEDVIATVKVLPDFEDVMYEFQVYYDYKRKPDLVTSDAISTDTYKRKAEPIEAELVKRQQEQKDTAARTKSWYEIIGLTLERLCSASENFRDDDFGTRRQILLAIGRNPVLTDKMVSIEPNPWVIPIKDKLPQLKSELSQVETVGPIKKNKSSLDRERSLVSSWCG